MRLRIAKKYIASMTALIACLSLILPAGAQYDAPAQQIPTFDPAQAPAYPPNVSPTQLRGLAEFTTVSAQANEVRAQLLPTCQMVGFSCMKITVKNNNDRLIVVNGDQAQADISGTFVGAASAQTLSQQAGCGMTASDTALLWGVGVGTLGLAGPILQEMLQKPPKYPRAQFGRDSVRQRIEQERLGRRLVLPGDETTGWMCFPTTQGATLGEVLVPIYSATQSGRVAVRLTAAQADVKTPAPRQ